MSAPTAADADGILLELLSPIGRADPYPHYRRLHALGGVHRSAVVGKIITDYRVCDLILRDSRAVKAPDRERPGRPDPADHGALALLGRTMLMLDPPDHTRLRRLVSKAFTPRTVAELRPAIEELLDQLLAPIAAQAADGAVIDLMDELAFPFPVGVIGRMIGVPAPDQPQFQDLVRDLTRALDLIVAEGELARADAAAERVAAYFTDLVAERRRHPADDLTSALIATREADDRLSEPELLAMLTLLFLAGFETTTNLIGNGVLALLDEPAQTARLREDPGGVPVAVEELLRFDAPVQMLARATIAPIELPDGGVIRADRDMLLLLGAANRDPRVFTDPDRLRLDRDEGPPISFGGGIHYCLGAGLARLEARLVFTALLDRFCAIEPAGAPARREGGTVRGLLHLPLRLTPSRTG
jgi:cytochrome P450